MIIGGLFLLLFLYLLEERVRGWWSLRSYEARLVQAGEKLEVNQLEPTHRPAPAQNVVTALQGLTNQFEAAKAVIDEAPPWGKIVSPGKYILSVPLRRWPVGENHETNTWERWDEKMEQQMGLLDSIHRALDHPGFDMGTDYHGSLSQQQPLQASTPVRKAGNWLTLAAHRELQNRRFAVAHERLLDCLRLVKQMHGEKWLLIQWVRISIGTMAWKVQVAALQETGWTDLQLRQQQSAWATLSPANDLVEALEMERSVARQEFKVFKQDGTALAERLNLRKHARAVLGIDDESDSILRTSVNALKPWFWRFVWAELDSQRSLEGWDKVLTWRRRESGQGWKDVFHDEQFGFQSIFTDLFSDSTPMTWESFRFPFSSDEASSSLSVSLRKAVQAQTECHLTVTAIACHRFHQATGNWPTSLQLLVPNYLEEVPPDTLGGGSLEYRTDPVRGFILYSKGADGIDDGGDASWPKDLGTISGNNRAKDLVWPQGTSLEETDTFLSQPKKESE